MHMESLKVTVFHAQDISAIMVRDDSHHTYCAGLDADVAQMIDRGAYNVFTPYNFRELIAREVEDNHHCVHIGDDGPYAISIWTSAIIRGFKFTDTIVLMLAKQYAYNIHSIAQKLRAHLCKCDEDRAKITCQANRSYDSHLGQVYAALAEFSQLITTPISALCDHLAIAAHFLEDT